MSNLLFSLDFESVGLVPYRSDFQVKSLAVAYSDSLDQPIKTKFFTIQGEIENCLRYLSEQQLPCICFNIGFESLVMKCKYPDIKINWVCDVMRLSQLRGLPDSDNSKDRATGFSLKATTRRFLPHLADYEQGAYQWLRDNKQVRKGSEGAHLHELPYEILKKYNENDVIATLQLYWYFNAFFTEEGYDWTVDWELYKILADFVIEAEIRGIEVNRDQLSSYIDEITEEVEKIDDNFVRKMGTNILQVREKLKAQQQAKYKKKIVTELPEFNITSKKHLEMLFVDELHQTYSITTPTGKPSFKAAHLGQWGDGGKILEKRGKRLLVESQVKNLTIMSENGSIFHPKLRIVGTKTGRLAGASQKKSYGCSLNLQAIARTDKPLMSSLLPRKGNIFISSDIQRGEPTVISYYTKDENYKLVNCDMAGKPPFMQCGVLISDDQYLTIGSITPFSRGPIEDLIAKCGGITRFGELWLHDPDELKKPIKSIRKVLKMAVLAMGYGAGPKKIFKACNEAGCRISMKECNDLYNAFWGMYPTVKSYTDQCTKQMERRGYIYNLFGFRCVTEPHKAYNMQIQSTINGIISLYIEEISKLTEFTPVTILHDEIIIEIPKSNLEQVRLAYVEASDQLNKTLGWDIPIRFGFVAGNTLYDAK